MLNGHWLKFFQFLSLALELQVIEGKSSGFVDLRRGYKDYIYSA